jgi:phage terminase large subunit-like protein
VSVWGRLREQLECDWQSQARKEQLPPPDNNTWSTWLLLAGRGFGKSLAGAQWVRHLAENGKVSHIALVSPTASDCRDVMIEGPSGLLSIAPNVKTKL